MNEPAITLTDPPEGYGQWLIEVKARIRSAQQRAALAVNTAMLRVYWGIGRDILDRQARRGWGMKVVERLSHDLRQEFPDLGGFSRANLMYMRSFAEAWPEDAIVQQAVGQLPWGHNIVLLTKLKDPEIRLAYAEAASEFGWSRVAKVAVSASVRTGDQAHQNPPWGGGGGLFRPQPTHQNKHTQKKK
ncbi:MAG: DUF1016 N-terminal domain-containing protein, partial [Propionibacteriaceae bacterium]|nr:DUF1016 N-terminal domain-containing protein [Propionibacteriaceae bacterium]